MTTALVTDSNAQLPPELVERYHVEVIPLTVVVDGVEHLEGVDLDADGFYAHFAGDYRPEVTTSQPSPGRFAAAYRRLVADGASDILSIHIGSAISGTLNSARVAAEATSVPVRFVDTGTSSFGIGCCVWEAGEALAAGASCEGAALVAESVGSSVDNVFVLAALDLLRAGGRVAVDAAASTDGVAVLSLVGSDLKVVGHAFDADGAVDLMASHCTRPELGDRLRVAVGVADASAAPLWHALEDRVRACPRVVDWVRYRIGPSVGAHTGPGTAGAFTYPCR